MFTTKTCPYCYMTKDYLKNKGFKYQDSDVSADYNAAMEMVNLSGQMRVPVAGINGNIVIGFNKGKIDSLLGSS